MEGGAELGLDAAEVDGEAQAEAEADAEAQAEAEAEAEAAAEEGAEEGADAEVRSAPPRATFSPPQQQHTGDILLARAIAPRDAPARVAMCAHRVRCTCATPRHGRPAHLRAQPRKPERARVNSDARSPGSVWAEGAHARGRALAALTLEPVGALGPGCPSEEAGGCGA